MQQIFRAKKQNEEEGINVKQEVLYTNITQGKGLILLGAIIMVLGCFLIFASPYFVFLIMFGAVVFYSGKIKYWWYNG